LNDLKASPIHAVYPGAMVQATAVSNLIEKHFLRIPSKAMNFLAVLLLMAVTHVAFYVGSGPLFASLFPVFFLGAYAITGVLLFQKYLVVLPMVVPLALGVGVLFEGLVHTLWIENRERRKMTATLNKFVAPAVVKQLIENGMDPRAEVGREAQMTILFSDIRNFTTISEGLMPAEIVEALNLYLGRMTDCVFEHSGTLDKFIGEAVMAFWGAPLPDEKQAERAIRCALVMQRMLKEKDLPWLRTAEFRTGIGINTGTAIVGNIGSEKRLDYT